MTDPLTDPAFERDAAFYSKALEILSKPTRRVALTMRAAKLAYWLFVISALLWLFLQVIDREPPVSVLSKELLTPEVRPGEAVKVRMSIDRHRVCETIVEWAIIDGADEIRRFGPIHVTAAGPPGLESIVRGYTVPANATPGDGRLRVVASWMCPGNYLQAIYPVSQVQPDIEFRIVARP